MNLMENSENILNVFDEVRGYGVGVGGQKQGDGGTDMCVCPECGYEENHKRSIPCNQIKCPNCNVKMVGK